MPEFGHTESNGLRQSFFQILFEKLLSLTLLLVEIRRKPKIDEPDHSRSVTDHHWRIEAADCNV
jgi:hypothetical protein